MGKKLLAIAAIYNGMAKLAAVDATGISATVVILIGVVLLTVLILSNSSYR